MIDRFQGEYRWLSNFWPCEVVAIFYTDPKLGVVTRSVEHAYQAMKAADPKWFAAICNAATPGAAKRLGKRCKLRPRWDELKLPVMAGLLMQKFTLSQELREKLLATGDQELVEGNTWGDTFWGVCNGKGENHLGRLLMEIRAQIRETP